MTNVEFIGALVVLAVALWALHGAWRLSTVEPTHRPVAWFLTLAIGCDVARLVINTRVAPIGSGPFVGWARVAFHAEQVMLWAQHLGIVALAYVALGGAAARVALTRAGCAVAILSVSLIAAYPELREQALRNAYLTAHVACSIAGGIAIAAWIKGERPRTTAAEVAVVLVVFDAIMLAGPFVWGVKRHWWMAQMVYSSMFAVIAFMQRRARWET